MTAEQIFTLSACVVFLGLAAIAAVRGAKNPLALPLAMLCVDMFAYNSLQFLGTLTRSQEWEWVESAAAALAAPLLTHLALVFLGQRREHRIALGATYAYFCLLALSSLLPLFAPALERYPGGNLWALLMLLGILPTFVGIAILLARHYRESSSAEERARTQLFIGTIVLGVGGPATDLFAIATESHTPRLAAGGMVLSALLLSALAFRFRLMRGTIALLMVNAAVIGVVGVTMQILVFVWAGRATASLVLGTLLVTLILLGAARAVWSAFTVYRERTAHLATLGRLSAQMAHDIRNPLAAIRGAAQYLETERDRGGQLADAGEFIELILEQADRLERVVRDYQRLGRAEPVRANVDVEKLVRSVTSGARVSEKASQSKVEVRAEIGPLPDPCAIDPDLVAAALENLIRNAIEAMEETGGSVIARAEREVVRGRESLRITVRDDGPGMDARTREQAEEAFFTTKATGSGLGLAFVRRVVEAHAGRMQIKSALGRGTTIVLSMPCDSRTSAH
jgi:two-component system, NtrC family, sensor histidine kinase HydH